MMRIIRLRQRLCRPAIAMLKMPIFPFHITLKRTLIVLVQLITPNRWLVPHRRLNYID